MKIWDENKTILIPVKEGFPEEVKEKLGCSIPLDYEMGHITTLYTLNKLPMEKILFLGMGDNVKTAFMMAGNEIKEDVNVYVEAEYAYQASLGLYLGLYNFKKKKDIHVQFSGCEKEVEEGRLLAECINEAKYWSDMPSNQMYSDVFKEQAVRIAKTNGLEIEILSNKELEKMNAGGILAVNAASNHPAYMITLKYNGNGDAPYLALIGKGLTFDAGGYSLKKNLRSMKYDMCGAANFLAVMDYISRKKFKCNVMAILGVTDNMVNEKAYCVDDVITMLNGKTVEITNTDAEGRLVLADCISHAQEFNVSHMMDMATLTGACANALGCNYTGVFTNDEEFLNQLKQASLETKEKIWQLPVDEDFHKQIQNSKVADLTNAQPGEKAGASLAAAFIEEFVQENVSWIHLDIAGSSLFKNEGNGVMIQTVTKLIENYSK